MNAAVVLTRAGFRAGALAVLPLAVGTAAVGLLYGFLAGQNGVTVLETMLMSLWIFAGSSQLVAAQLWTDPLPVASLVAAVLTINVRHLLMSATLAPWLAGQPTGRAYGSLFLLTDEVWGVTTAEIARGGRDLGFMIGAGLTLYLFWNGGSLVGRLFGTAFSGLDRYGFDFLGTALFVALAASFWRGRSNLLPWLIAAASALAVERFVPGTWHILAGGMAGSLAGAWLHVRRA